jgi:predicted HD phosphohydrolase
MVEQIAAKRAKFTRMDEGTQQDWMIIAGSMFPFAKELPDRVLTHLSLLHGDHGGFAVDRLEHCLQTATRAANDGRDEEYVVCALIHDIGDILGTYNHADIAASILEPFVSEQNFWMVKHHGIFQGYYFFHYLGLDRNMRNKFKEHPFYDYTLEFCEKYDSPAFDPEYKSMPLAEFEPLVRKVMAKPKKSIYIA